MKLLEVPYIPQINKNACGAAVLEMVYRYYGLNDISQEGLMARYQELEPHGSGNARFSTDSLVADAKGRGFNAGWARANWESIPDVVSLLRFLTGVGVPVIVCQKFTVDQPLIGHFRIVLGVVGNRIILHDPHAEFGGDGLDWSEEKFVDFWRPTGQNVTGGIFVFITR